MANAKMTVDFKSDGSQTVTFSSVEGITPGRIRKAEIQARRELGRLVAILSSERREMMAAREAQAKAEEVLPEAPEVEEEEEVEETSGKTPESVDESEEETV